MTKINRMVMKGFKSFAKRTEFLFGNQFNCVLGPNGSGKSNVLDALCFVLGRGSAKSLRAEKSSNLIYNGGKTKKPMNEGEVSIFFDNKTNTFPTEDEEIKISRIIKPSGQSIYKINDKKRTRQQILELLSVAKIDPDGYNIILQGDIVRFCEMAPTLRREIVEEIAGISVYQEKKEKALKQLEKVDERIKEAEIVLTERGTYLKELKKERDQALKFKDLKDKVDENKATYCHIQIEKKNKEKETLDKNHDKNKNNFDDFQKKIEELKQLKENQKNEIQEISDEIEEKGEEEQVKLHKEVESLKIQLATKKTKIEATKNEIEKIKQRKKQLAEDLESQGDNVNNLVESKKNLEKKKQVAEGERKKIEEQLKVFRKKHEIDSALEIEKDIEKLDSEAEEKQKEIQGLREEQQNDLREKDKIEFQIRALDEKIEKVKKVEEEHKDQVEGLKNKRTLFKEITLELNKRLTNDSSLASQLGNARRKYISSQEELAKLQAKNVGIKEKVSGNIAIKKILELKNQRKGIYGTVSDLGQVNSKYSLALEIAAGNRIKSIVVEDDKVAADCIKYLKTNKLGVATFLPLNKLKGKGIDQGVKKLLDMNGAVDFAVNLVNYENKFKNVFLHVFSNTLVVNDIDSSRRIGIGQTRMVTLEGDLVEVSGAMQGGFRQRKGKGLGFQEKELVKDIDEYEDLVSNLNSSISSLEEKKTENENKIISLRQEKANLEGEIIKMEKSLHLEEGDVDVSKNLNESFKKNMVEVDEKINVTTSKISELNRLLADNRIKKQQLRDRINHLRKPTLIAELNAFDEKKNQLIKEIIDIDANLRSVSTQIEMVEPEQGKINDIIKQHSKEIDDFNNKIKRLLEEVKGDENSLKEKEVKEREFYAQYKGLFNKRTKINDELYKTERKMDVVMEESRKVELKLNTVSLEVARVSAELAGLNQEFEQYKDVKINRSKDEQQIKSEINKFQNIVQQMGSVNLKALDIYDSVEKEYQSLIEKKDKLGIEKEDVLNMMNEIEGKKKELFLKTLEAVNSNFQSIFSALSTKGEASLDLENPDDPFEGGILIKVRLTGTKFLDIRSLSGGEKTMTALAFIFAIQEDEPASFYILDEVDAALDKHNSEKLAKLVRNYCDKAQYIVISHNDSVISEADSLFGISMNEHGITQVTSLKI